MFVDEINNVVWLLLRAGQIRIFLHGERGGNKGVP